MAWKNGPYWLLFADVAECPALRFVVYIRRNLPLFWNECGMSPGWNCFEQKDTRNLSKKMEEGKWRRGVLKRIKRRNKGMK